VTEKSLEELTLTAVQDEIDVRLERLPLRAQASFYVWAARGLLPAYERFARRQAWGDVEALRRAIDLGDGFASRGQTPSPREAGGLAEALQSAAPHADDFDDPDTIGAQDALIAADAALRLARGIPVAGIALYVLEHAELAVTFRRTGTTGLGSGPEADAWNREIMLDPTMRAGVRAIDAALADLESNRPIAADGRALDAT
jgi:hypothetical protein